MKKGFFAALSILIGCTIGAGILGIPYVASESGPLTTIANIFLVCFLVTIVTLFLGEIYLRTKGNHQLIGLVEKYFGKRGRLLFSLVFFFELYCALIAYIIGSGQALTAIFNTNPVINSLIFYIIFSILLYFGLKLFAEAEVFLTVGMFFVIIFLTVISFQFINIQNFTGFQLGKFYLPFGVVLFATMGVWSVSEMKQELKDKKLLKKAIILGVAISSIVYIIFTAVVLGVTGKETTEIATLGLKQLGTFPFYISNLFAVFTMSTSFLALGYSLKDSLKFDFKLKNSMAWLLTISLPLIVFLLKITTFIQLLSIAGVFGSGITLIVIILMHKKAVKNYERKPEYKMPSSNLFYLFLILIIIFAIIYELLKIIN